MFNRIPPLSLASQKLPPPLIQRQGASEMLLPLETLLENHPEAASVREQLNYLGGTLPTTPLIQGLAGEPSYHLSTKVTDLSD